MRGYIYEFTIYNVALNLAQTIIVNNYLKAKYGFSLLSNDIYGMDSPGNGDYDHDVTGIGQASDGTNHQDARGTGVVRMRTPSNLGNSEFLIWGHDNGALNSFGVSDFPASQSLEGRIARVWRASETGEVGTISISFDLSGVYGSKTAADLRLLVDRTGDGTFADEGASGVISGAVNIRDDIFEWTGVDIDNGERFTVGTVNLTNTPLPIELLDFNAKIVGDIVEIDWTTLSEINNDFFTIERSMDLNNWELIITVAGAGNSRLELSYKSFDDNPLQGISYYRLKQTDFNGDFTYSQIKSVNLTNSKRNQIVIIPNPASNVIRLKYGNHSDFFGKLKIYNSENRLTKEVIVDQADQSIAISDLEPGLYVLMMYDYLNNIIGQEKLIIE